MMDSLHSVEDFEAEDGVHPISSPRSLEACLRAGFDPSELLPRTPESFFPEAGSEDFAQIKYDHFEERRQQKLAVVRRERDAICQLLLELEQDGPESPNKARVLSTFLSPDLQRAAMGGSVGGDAEDEERAKAAEQVTSQMMEMERKRLEAVKRRQQQEIAKFVAREQQMAELQAKIAHTEEEERKRQKAHAKEVAKQREAREAKAKQMEERKQQQEEEEIHQRRLVAAREAELERKLAQQEFMAERTRRKEAIERDLERRRKKEEQQRQTEQLLQLQVERAEESRRRLEERERRLEMQLQERKARIAEEVRRNREKAERRIEGALERNMAIQAEKKRLYEERQAAAAVRAQERAQEQRELLARQAEQRRQREERRLNRLEDAHRMRQDRRSQTISHRREKDSRFQHIADQRERDTAMQKFLNDMRLAEKQENVERQHRMDEFARLQTLQRIKKEDEQFERTVRERESLAAQRREAAREALIRKHHVEHVMHLMKTTNNYDLLDSLSGDGKRRRRKRKSDGESPPGTA